MTRISVSLCNNGAWYIHSFPPVSSSVLTGFLYQKKMVDPGELHRPILLLLKNFVILCKIRAKNGQIVGRKHPFFNDYPGFDLPFHEISGPSSEKLLIT